jgi:hypothetical protein
MRLARGGGAARLGGVAQRILEEAPGDRRRISLEVFDRTRGDDFAAPHAGAGA